MKKVTIKALNEAASKLMFELDPALYNDYIKDFKSVLDEMEIIGQIPGIEEAEPMFFPYETYVTFLRDDVSKVEFTKDEAIQNSNCVKGDKIALPKVI